jgi:hypothetical protein
MFTAMLRVRFPSSHPDIVQLKKKMLFRAQKKINPTIDVKSRSTNSNGIHSEILEKSGTTLNEKIAD